MFGSNQPLTGNRTFAAASLTAAGLVSPGNSPGKINIVGDFTLLSSSVLLIELEGTLTGIDYDIVNVGGNATLGGSRLDLSLLGSFQSRVQPTDTFTVLLAGTAGNGGQLIGAFGNIANGGRLLTTDGLGSFQVNYGANSAFSRSNVVLSNFAAVPEPSTWVLMGGGALATAFVLRRRKS
ncbi:MAG: PEP-CTERM sorting domain-containing protein [Opitutaceae bacterium]